MKYTFLLPLLLLFAAGAHAQQCNCKTSYEWVKKTFEENDAGYAHILQSKGKEAYALHNRLTLDKVKKITDTDDCIKALEDWVRFFRTDHFRFTKTQTAVAAKANASQPLAVKKSHEEMLLLQHYLQDSKTLNNLEGIWESDDAKIAIEKKQARYTGFVISSTSLIWHEGDTRFTIDTSLKTGMYLTGFKPMLIDKVSLIGDKKELLQLNNMLLKKVHPAYTPDSSVTEYYAIKTMRTPFGYKRDSNTVYLHINSFNYENKKAIDSVLQSLHALITSTPNLIIDLRDCQGGSDQSFKKLIPYIYTNPIRSVMAEFYSTPMNNKMWTEVAQREGLEEEEKAMYQKIATLMNSRLGEYVNIFGKDVDVMKLDKVLPYPQNIGIIIHENNFSTTEEFILKAKQSRKVKFFGRKTGGALDVSNMVEAKEPAGNFIFEYCISRSLRIPEFPVDDMGLHPDFYLDRSIPENEWVDYVSTILSYK